MTGAGTSIDEIRSIARSRLVPLLSPERPAQVNRPLIRELGDAGLLGRMFPTAFGGSAASDSGTAMTLCTLREALAQESTEAAMALALQAGGSFPLLDSANVELAQRCIPAVLSGEMVAAIAVSEMGAGSDAGAIGLRAERCVGGWRLSGAKAWVMNAPDADMYTVFARTSPNAGARGITSFVVFGDAEGLTGVPIEILRPHAMGHLEFDDVFVPDSQVLSEIDAGFASAMRTFELFRPAVGAYCVGASQAALDLSVEYSGAREAFGQQIRRFQAVSHQLADMATQLEAARLLVYSAARAYDSRDPDAGHRSAMAKLFASETAQYVVDAAIQIHGARALEKGHLLSHLYTDIRGARIEEGTSEIQRNIIARGLIAAR